MFKDMQVRVQNYIADTSSATLVIIKDEINSAVENFLQTGFWKFGLRDTTFTTTSGTSDYYLPSDVDKVLDITQQDSPIQLKQVWIADFDRLVPKPTNTSKPLYFMETNEDRVLAQPTASSKIILRSSSNQDLTGLTGSTMVSIFGVSGSEDRNETVTLSATNVLSSVNSYTKLYAISPDIAPVGTLRFTQAITGTTLLQLYPGETARNYKKIKLHPIPDASYTMYVRYQALSPKMINDSDICVIPPRYEDIITNTVIGQMLLRQGDQKAISYIQLAQAQQKVMEQEQDIMWNYEPTVRPADSGYGYRDYSYPFTNF